MKVPLFHFFIVPAVVKMIFVVAEKIKEKKQLEEKKQTLAAELNELQSRHSQLTISLNDQKTKQEELITSQQSTENKIQQILSFIENIKKPNENAAADS